MWTTELLKNVELIISNENFANLGSQIIQRKSFKQSSKVGSFVIRMIDNEIYNDKDWLKF